MEAKMNFRNFAVLMTLVISSLSVNAVAEEKALPISERLGVATSVKANNPKEIMFIHGMFVTPLCWENWIQSFEDAGYVVSAPAWPLHDGSVEELRQESRLEALGQLTFEQVLNHYREILRKKTTKPILVGHSMGGLFAQILLSEGLGQAAVVIDSAAPKGIFVTNLSFLRSNAGVFNVYADPFSPLQMDLEDFSYAFVNAQPQEEQAQAYNRFYVPESRRVGRGPLTKYAKVDFSKPRGPLLMIAGGADHIIPAELNYKNFKSYKNTPGVTDFYLMSGRDHTTIVSPGWEKVVSATQNWLEQQFPN
jgi:pimeloyl-ACP methyl ester carboxylesterase